MDCRVLTQLITHFQKRIYLYVTVILAFSYHFLFEKDLPCTCENFIRDCALYMALPFSIICVAQLWVDRALQRSCQVINIKKKDHFCLVCSHLLSVFFVSCIWPISLLIDGDWSACCWTQSSHNVTCKNNNLLTDEDRAIIRVVKNQSRVAGLSFLLGLLLFACVISCCRNNSKCLKKGEWLEIVLEEEENVISDELRKKAKEQLQEKMTNLKNQNWAKDYNIGSGVIGYLKAPEPVSGPSVHPSGTSSGPRQDNIALCNLGTTSGAPSQPSAEWNRATSSQQDDDLKAPFLEDVKQDVK